MKKVIIMFMALGASLVFVSLASADLNGTWNITYSGMRYDYYTDQIESIKEPGTITISQATHNVTVTLTFGDNQPDPDGAFSGFCGNKTFGAKRTDTDYTDIIVGAINNNNVLSGTVTICDLYYGSSAGARVLSFSSDPSAFSDVKGDVNSDGKIGLEEAVYALQVVAGIKLHPEDEEQIRANLAAAVDAYNNKNIDTLMSYFSLNYLDDGSDYNAERTDFENQFSGSHFEQIFYTINSIVVTGDTATVSVTWDGEETEVMHWIKENGNWKIYGNQERYENEIGLFSAHWTSGYYAEIYVIDPDQNATSVRATGPGISGTMEFQYKSGDGLSPAMWWNTYNLFLGTSVPTEPQTFTITITDESGTYIYEKTITDYVTEFATNLSPTGNVSGTIAFFWTGIPDATEYDVELSDSNNNRIWNAYNLPSTTTSVVYDGPSLTVGETYHYAVVSRIGTNGVSNSSFAKQTFTVEELTEQWVSIADGGQGSGNWTLTKESDGTITADGNWVYSYLGADVTCPFTDGPVTISGSSISFTATGTATNPSAPVGYQTSPFDLSVSGTTNNGTGSGTFTITFSTYGWPSSISGTWEATRTSGSGITQ